MLYCFLEMLISGDLLGVLSRFLTFTIHLIPCVQVDNRWFYQQVLEIDFYHSCQTDILLAGLNPFVVRLDNCFPLGLYFTFHLHSSGQMVTYDCWVLKPILNCYDITILYYYTFLNVPCLGERMTTNAMAATTN